MPNLVPTATQGVTVYSFSVATCELKGCGTMSAVGQELSKLPKAHTVGKIQDDVEGEEQERCVNLLGISCVGWRLNWRALDLFVAGFPQQN